MKTKKLVFQIILSTIIRVHSPGGRTTMNKEELNNWNIYRMVNNIKNQLINNINNKQYM